MSGNKVQSPPNSGMVLWMRYDPDPVASSGKHSFLVESAKTSTVHQDVTSWVVRVVAGGSSGLRLSTAVSGPHCRVSGGGLGVLAPGTRTAMTDTDMAKQAGTLSRAEDVETRISFQAVTPAGRRLPPGAGVVMHKYPIRVAIA